MYLFHSSFVGIEKSVRPCEWPDGRMDMMCNIYFLFVDAYRIVIRSHQLSLHRVFVFPE